MGSIGSFGAVQKAIDKAERKEPDTFDFYGETFHVIDTVPSALPLMQFAAAMSAADEDDSINMEALGAMYNMLRYCVDPGDWQRFEKLAMKRNAGIDEIFPITQAVWASVSGDPTNGPSASPNGPSRATTSPSSKGPSRKGKGQRSKRGRQTADDSAPDLSGKTPANAWEPPPGRPDLAVVLTPVEDLPS